MKITEKLLNNILKKTQDAREIAQLITTYQDIEIKIQKTIKDDQEAEKDYKLRLAGNRQTRKDIQEKCDHPVWTFFGDASGGNDSYRICDICRYEF